MVEGARLESVYTGNCIKGSNPFLSASKAVSFYSQLFILFIYLHKFHIVESPRHDYNNSITIVM